MLPPSTPHGGHQWETICALSVTRSDQRASGRLSWVLEGKRSAATCRMRVCSGVDARVREQSDRRSRVASTRRRNRRMSMQSVTRSEATQRQRALFRLHDGASDSRIASTRPVRAERARRRQSRRVCSTELFTRSCLVSEPPHTARVQLHWLPAKPRISQTARIAQSV